MVLALGFLPVGIAAAIVGIVGRALHLIAVALLGVQHILRVDHREQHIAQVFAVHVGTQHAQPSVYAFHGHLAHTLQYIVHALGLCGLGHERLVNHHSTESLAVILLKYHDELCHPQPLGVDQVECVLPACVGFEHGHQLADLRC